MRAIVSVAGKDRVGIIAGICVALAQNGVNVLDISQTVMQDFFTMNMLVDTSTSTVSFAEISAALDEAGRELAVSVRIQREDIFEAMHRI